MNFSIVESFVYLAGNLFRIYIISMLFDLFFGTEVSFRRSCVRKIGYILYYIINSAGFIYFSWPPYIILLTNIAATVGISSTYLGTWKNRMCVIVLSLALHTLCENMIYHLIVLLEIEHIMVVGIIAADILFFMIVLLFKKAVAIKNHVDIPFVEWITVVVVPTLSLFVSTLVLDKCNSEKLVAVGEISLVLINILLFFLIERVQKVYEEQLDVNLLKQQNQAYENQMLLISESEEKISSLKHDLKNHLFSIQQLAEQKQLDMVISYVKNLLCDVEIYNGTIQSFAETGNFVIDSFLNTKLTKASSIGANINIDVKISKKIRIDDKDISTILGNLLDNAITALQKCSGERNLRITLCENSGTLFLKIENSHQEGIRKVGDQFLSTKAKSQNHGIGLKNVQKIVERYQGLMEIDYSERMFSVRLILFL